MSPLRRFNPAQLSDDLAESLATGREAVLADLLRHVENNRDSRPMQHVQLVAPRGFGKSFLMKLLGIELRRRPGLLVVTLPEEQRNIRKPFLLLDEIRRLLEGRPPADVVVRWSAEDEAWDIAAAALDSAIAERCPGGFLVAIVENFDHLLATAFRDDKAQMRLRGLLARENGRLMLVATAPRTPDSDYSRPLFKAFARLRLRPWTEDDALAFFDRVRQSAGEPPFGEDERARARSIALFAGGSPRIATVLYEVLQTRDAISAAALDKLVDELSDYYRNRIDSLSPRAQDVLDTLLRIGEPKSQTEVAAAMGESQSRVAEVFRELLADEILTGVPATRSRATLYRVTDRLMVHFYRTRLLHVGASSLEAIADFLAAFFSAEEQRREAARLRAANRAEEAAVFENLLAGKVAPPWWMPRPDAEASPAGGAPPSATPDGDPEFAALLDKAAELGKRGEHDAAITASRRAFARAEAPGGVAGQAKAPRGWWAHARKGEHDAAIETLRAAIGRA
ncbi:MAG: hypothetical protein HQL38_20465, partial [Alphaproteobacteria bacterium]|nr:hypothetical protein [Alphaproteobacteria bacterium]